MNSSTISFNLKARSDLNKHDSQKESFHFKNKLISLLKINFSFTSRIIVFLNLYSIKLIFVDIELKFI